jgi:hypothetical protein
MNGELFWKLSHGYGAMPIWVDMPSDDNCWQLVAFIRGFKKSQKSRANPGSDRRVC